MYIQYTFVHFAILLIRHVSRAVPLPVTISFAVEALSSRLGSSFELLHGSDNLLVILLEVPFLSLCPFLETSGLVNYQHLMLFLISTFADFSIAKSSDSFSSSLTYYSSSRTCSNLVIVTREFFQLL